MSNRPSDIFIFTRTAPSGPRRPAGVAACLFLLSSLLLPNCLKQHNKEHQTARTSAERQVLSADSLFDIRQFSYSLNAYYSAATACPEGSEPWIHCQRQIAASLWRTHHADSAMQLCKVLLPQAKAVLGENHPEIAQIMIVQGNTQCDRRTDDGLAAALAFFEPAVRILEAFYPPGHPEIALGYDRLLIAYWLNDEYPKALEMARYALECLDTSASEARLAAIKLQSHKGLVLRSAGQYTQALRAFEEAYRLEGKGSANTRISDHLVEIAQTHTEMGDPHEALYLLQRALAIEQAQGDEGTKTRADIHKFMGKAYHSMGQLDSAVVQYQIALRFWNPEIGDDVNGYKESSLLLGKALLEKGETSSAISGMVKTLEISEKHFGPDNFNICPLLQALGEAYFARSKLETAEQFYLRALAISKSKVGQNHPKTGELLSLLAALQIQKGQKQKALSNVKQAQRAFYTATSPAFITDYIGLIRAMHLEGRILLNDMLRSSDRMTSSHPVTIKRAIAAFKKGVELADSVRLGLGHQSRQLTVQKEVVAIATSALLALETAGKNQHSSLNTQSKHPLRKEKPYADQTLADAFYFIEKSKAAAMQAAFHKVCARTQAGLPASVSLQEEKYKAQMRYALQNLQDQTADTDAGTRLQHMESYAAARSALDSFEQALGREYPKYHALKTAIQVPDTAQLALFVQARRRSMVSFFWGKTHCYAYVASPKGQKWVNLGASTQIEASIRAVLHTIRQAPSLFTTDAEALARMQAFCAASHRAFQQIILPLGLEDNQNLTVIPDGPLYYLPFEALLTARADSTALQHLDYRALPYMGLTRAINFENSVEILLTSEQLLVQKMDYIGFAPSYAYSPFPPLRYNMEEVRLAKAQFGGKIFEQDAATEKAFYLYCPQADLLHLACHSIIDERSNEKSYFAFAQNGKIHWYDLYNLHLKARLAVLSACNTNDGQWNTGEGVSSLSSALHYAGCKAMLATRWPIDDAAASQYIGLSLKALSSTANHMGEAHHKAIVHYLKTTLQTRKCHPFYWAAFVVYGEG